MNTLTAFVCGLVLGSFLGALAYALTFGGAHL